MMMRELLPSLQQSLPTQQIAQHAACTLSAATRPRWLLVVGGRLWVTGLATEARGGDLFLDAGESALVPAGVSVVIEAMPTAPHRGPAPAAQWLWVESEPASSARPGVMRPAATRRGLRLRAWPGGALGVGRAEASHRTVPA